MITFKRFLTEEKAPLPKTEEETKKALWDFEECIEGGLNSCKIVDTINGPAVNVEGSVNLKALSLKYLPFRFNIVKGDFHCSMNKELVSIEGAPMWVKGVFNFEHCWSLKNLDYLGMVGFRCEDSVIFSHCHELERICESGKIIYGGGFNFSDCEALTSLKGLGTIFGNLNITGTAIKSFHDFHKDVAFCEAEVYRGYRTGDLVLFNGKKHQMIEDSSLNLMMVKNLKTITYSEKVAPWLKIIEDGIQNKADVLDVQSELIDAGFKAQAKL